MKTVKEIKVGNHGELGILYQSGTVEYEILESVGKWNLISLRETQNIEKGYLEFCDTVKGQRRVWSDRGREVQGSYPRRKTMNVI